ncbi:MAG: hypothetical protein WAQ52_13735 [Terriglobales bacterium]
MLWIFAVYLLFWITVVSIYVPGPTLLSVAIPLVITICTTTVDEIAESGKEARPKIAVQKFFVNIQWALMVFYFSVARGIILPGMSSTAADLSFFFALFSLALGLISTIAIRRTDWLGPLLAMVSLCGFLWLGIKYFHPLAGVKQ